MFATTERQETILTFTFAFGIILFSCYYIHNVVPLLLTSHQSSWSQYAVEWMSCGPSWGVKEALQQAMIPMLLYWFLSLFYLILDFYFESKDQLSQVKILYPRYKAKLVHRLYQKAIKIMVFNTFFSVAAFLLVFQPLVKYFRGAQMCIEGPTFPTDLAALQSVWQSWAYLLLQFVGVYLLTDVVFYSTHRLAHEWSFLYQHVHKLHHQFVTTYGVCASAAHPVEQIFVNLNTIFLPAIIVGLPYNWLTIWLCLAVIDTIAAHSGYKFPPMYEIAAHDRHHHFVHCDYGSAGFFLDRFLRTRYEDVFPHRVFDEEGKKV